MPLAYVLQHIRCEPPGRCSGPLRDRGYVVETVELAEGGGLPDWREAGLVLAMGGPMGAYDEAVHPWLAAEKRWIAAAVRAGTPYFGVCLGAQLLAACLGARVYRGARPEIGIYDDVELTAEAGHDPVFAHAPARITTLQWHSDTFELPAGARRLATSAAYANQAFAWRRAYGLQFHLEASAELAATWLEVPDYAAEARRELGSQALERLAGTLYELGGAPPLARELFGRWIEHVVRPARAPAAAREPGAGAL